MQPPDLANCAELRHLVPAIACFVFSTHDTDYIMVRGADCLLLILCNTQVKEDKVTAATAALKAAGHTVKEVRKSLNWASHAASAGCGENCDWRMGVQSLHVSKSRGQPALRDVRHAEIGEHSGHGHQELLDAGVLH